MDRREPWHDRFYWIAAYEDDVEFWENFIRIYRTHPILWWTKYDNTIDLLKKKEARYQAIRELLDYCMLARPDLQRAREFVNVNIGKIYSAYLKEYKLVKRFKRIGKKFRPSLLFYDKLSFIVCEEENNFEVLNEINDVFLPTLQMKPPNEKVFTTVDLKTPAPTIISASSSILCKPNKLLVKEEPENLELSSELSNPPMMIKIELCDPEDLNTILKNESDITQDIIVKEEPKLYSESYSDYEFVEMDFVDDSFILEENKEIFNEQGKRTLHDNGEENELTKSLPTPKKPRTDSRTIINQTNYSTLLKLQDEFMEKLNEENDIYGKDVAVRLKKLNSNQRMHAKRIINEIFAYAKSNKLTVKSRVLP